MDMYDSIYSFCKWSCQIKLQDIIYIIFYLNLYLQKYTILYSSIPPRGKTKIKKPVNTGKTTNIVSQEKNSW
jgi:hypothetical protein